MKFHKTAQKREDAKYEFAIKQDFNEQEERCLTKIHLTSSIDVRPDFCLKFNFKQKSCLINKKQEIEVCYDIEAVKLEI